MGLKLLASQPDTIRAWPGGFGYAKLGANYGPSLAAHGQAQSQGFDQVLWLFGEDRQVTEAGASNFFIVWENAQTGKRELVTAPLENQLILPGVTRRSVLELARTRLNQTVGDLGAVEVVEKTFTIKDVETAWKEGRVVEAFVCGTAVCFLFLCFSRSGDSNCFSSSSLPPSRLSGKATWISSCSRPAIRQPTPHRSSHGLRRSCTARMALRTTSGRIALRTRAKSRLFVYV